MKLNKRQKALTLNALARKAKARLHEKMGNLTFMYPRKLLIISNVAENSTCRLFKKCKAGALSGRIMQMGMQQCLCELHLYMDGGWGRLSEKSNIPQ